MPSSTDPRLLNRACTPAEALKRMRAVPDDNNDDPTDVAIWIANAKAQDAEMTAGENDFLNELSKRQKAR
jgi:hypothetical protein